MDWNIEKSIETLKHNAKSESQHQCAKYVRIGLEAGGLDLSGHPSYAKDYAEFLPKIGFTKVAELSGREEQSGFKALPGDISIMDHGDYGHICVWCSDAWISDYIQTRMWAYSGEGLCKIFRMV